MLFLASGLVSASWALDFYGVDWSGTSGAPATSSLYRIGSGGDLTTIGDTGLTRLNNLAFTNGGDLATMSSTNGSGYVISKSTGAATFLFDQSGMASDDIRALAIDSTGWYVINEGAPDQLYRIDPSSGVATLVGSTGVSSLQSLAFDPTSGLLYSLNIGPGEASLGTISTSTGAFTSIGLSVLTGADSQTLTFDSAGTLYGLETNEIYTWNKATGEATVFGSGTWGVDVRGAEVVPEPATMTVLGLAALAATRRRKK